MHAATSGGDAWSEPCGTNNKITPITIYVDMFLPEAESEHTLFSVKINENRVVYYSN